MKAILLAAGLGSRLKPITNNIPKCLVEIDGKPLLSYWIETLIELGVTDILINTHYLSEQVELFVEQCEFKDRIQLVYEPVLLGTAGTLVRNADFWQNDTTIIIHADNFCRSDLKGLMKQHRNRPGSIDISLLLFKTESPKSCGIVLLDSNQVITNFFEKVDNPPSNLASGALFVFSPNVYTKYFSKLKRDFHYELSIDIVPSFLNSMQGWEVDDVYMDIGTPESYEQANNIMNSLPAG